MGRFTSRLTASHTPKRAPAPEVGPFKERRVPPEMEPGKRADSMHVDRRYCVIVYTWTFDGAPWRQLAVRRHDHKPIRDHWAVLQAIKDAVLGPEAEAVELYPAAGRLMDVEHTYHLWSPVGCTFPFGFTPDGAMTARDDDHG